VTNPTKNIKGLQLSAIFAVRCGVGLGIGS